MLVKLPEGKNSIQIPGLPPHVVPLEPVQFRYSAGHGRYAKLRQFPVTVGYAITDFKCQGQTFDWIRVDLKKPPTGFSPAMSPYVQLSRVKRLDHLSIMRPFTKEELCSPLPDDLLKELQWEDEMARKTMAVYETRF
jgi:hypothetical protein